MNNTLLTISTLAGLVIGFIFGVAGLGHVTKGYRMQELLKNQQARLLLGLLGWVFALFGAWLGYHITLWLLS